MVMNMKINDLVTRKKYNNDILFRIIKIEKDKVILKGEFFRLIADADIEDLTPLEIRNKQKVVLPFISVEKNVIKGRVLHLDGDAYYLKKALDSYKEYGIDAVGYYLKEENMPLMIKTYLEKHQPDILVITGHDSYKINENRYDINSYLNSKHFINTIKEARQIIPSKDELVIVAGACQSYYEELIKEGANFASSPARANIHLFDPVIIASFVACYRINQEIDVEYILSSTLSKGMGGIETKGKARKTFIVGGK